MTKFSKVLMVMAMTAPHYAWSQGGAFWGGFADGFNRSMSQAAAIQESQMRIQMMRIERRERHGTREITRLELLEESADRRVLTILQDLYNPPKSP